MQEGLRYFLHEKKRDNKIGKKKRRGVWTISKDWDQRHTIKETGDPA